MTNMSSRRILEAAYRTSDPQSSPDPEILNTGPYPEYGALLCFRLPDI